MGNNGLIVGHWLARPTTLPPDHTPDSVVQVRAIAVKGAANVVNVIGVRRSLSAFPLRHHRLSNVSIQPTHFRQQRSNVVLIQASLRTNVPQPFTGPRRVHQQAFREARSRSDAHALMIATEKIIAIAIDSNRNCYYLILTGVMLNNRQCYSGEVGAFSATSRPRTTRSAPGVSNRPR